jgi:hypothetical protein
MVLVVERGLYGPVMGSTGGWSSRVAGQAVN